ncbi:MAG: hypothetical protein H6925_00150 [Holosporaceae bacterium]|nr:MAG: hypothetical protein H6925_00150 [Holosporaceae bacterium]
MKNDHNIQSNKTLSDVVHHYLVENEQLFCLKDLHSLMVKELEKPLILSVLKKTKNNQSKAAEILGMNRNTLKKKMIDLNLIRKRKSFDSAKTKK